MNDDRYTARLLVDEAKENKSGTGSGGMLRFAESLPETLGTALDYALADFNYREDRESNIGTALRIVAVVAAEIEVRNEEFLQFKNGRHPIYGGI